MTNSLDDVADGRPPQRTWEWPLNKVGMENIACEIQLDSRAIAAQADAFVSLVSKDKRGIHMSRLFRKVTDINEKNLSRTQIQRTLDEMLHSHEGISDAAYLELRFQYSALRKALLSQETGWRQYPVRVLAQSGVHGFQLSVEITVDYSSTCPCSASLSRQAIRDQFLQEFGGRPLTADEVAQWLNQESSMVALPHAQRSAATGRFVMTPNAEFPSLVDLVNAMETALGTPVQTAVKREDEQEFARLNAKNLMFCEDAARKLKAKFFDHPDFEDFRFEVRHFESLHAHDAVAMVTKK